MYIIDKHYEKALASEQYNALEIKYYNYLPKSQNVTWSTLFHTTMFSPAKMYNNINVIFQNTQTTLKSEFLAYPLVLGDLRH